MDLKEFVKTALEHIAHGLEEAQNSLGSAASVNAPYEMKNGVPALTYARKVQPVIVVDFDVWCREASSETFEVEGTAKAGIYVFTGQVDGEFAKAKEEDGVTHLRFSVPLHVPSGQGLR